MIEITKQDEQWFNEEYCLEAVKQNGYNIIFVKHQTPLIVYYALNEYPNLDVDLIHISESEWNEFKDKNPELFI